MTARPSLVVLALAGAGAAALLFVEPPVRSTTYVPAGIGALVALAASAWLLRELGGRGRTTFAVGAGVLGFLAGSVSGVGPFPASLAYAAAFLPAGLLFLAGVGRDRLVSELSRLEDASDDAAARPRVAARAAALRDQARVAARALDPEGRETPPHFGDPRAVHAYAAQVLARARALDGAYGEAVAALGEVPVPWMPAPLRTLMVGNLSFYHLSAGDPAAALAVLDRLSEAEAEAVHRPVLRAARALALVHLDRAGEALALVGRDDGASLPPEHLRARYALVRVCALVALGEDDAARVALSAALAAPEGREEIARLRPAVPARAASMLDGSRPTGGG